MSVFDQYETVIGLECHVQLLTQSKLFSPAPNRYGDEANQNVDVVDVGLPGVLPVPQDRAVRLAIRLGLALGCDIRRHNVFARKHYFYPDLPKGYQISQMDEPICEGGQVTITLDGVPHNVALTRIHMEEDAGKSIHGDDGVSLVDYNRAGTPLLEVVSEPVMRSADEAMAYVRALHQLVVWLGVCDGNMQEGSLRADANVSVRKHGDTQLGERTELKNLNSIRFLGQAITHEAQRQVLELEAGRPVIQQTRLWDPDKKESRAMRTKEDAHDYRYFPDPDLMPIILTDAEIAAARDAMGELPRDRAARYVDAFGLSPHDADALCAEPSLGTYFETACAVHNNPKAIANWLLNDALAVGRGDDDDPFADRFGVAPQALADLVRHIDERVITSTIAKTVFAALVDGRCADVGAFIATEGLRVERDEGKLNALVDAVMTDNPDQVAQYRSGKEKLLTFFVGQIMKKTRGQADAAEVSERLKEKLKP